MKKLVIGIDYGTDSCRAILVNSTNGIEIASFTSFYPRWKQGLYCNPSLNQYRQHPQDYIDSLTESIKGLLESLSSDEINNIVSIGIDTTGSTPALTDSRGTPLALLPEFSEDPDAMFILWKDHTSIKEANDINSLAKSWDVDFTSRSGGIYSSEWFWAKALRALRVNKSIRTKAYSIIEHCDWMPALLTGNIKPEMVKRSRCAAGHKGMWAEEWGGYPSEEFLSTLDPLLKGFRSRLSDTTYTSDISAGRLSIEWAEKLGLSQNVEVAVGLIDAHAGAIGAGISSNKMVKIVGTSTCDIVVAPVEEIKEKQIPGISGQVNGSVIPGLIGLEAGQSAFGDVFAWFKNMLAWPINSLEGFSSLSETEKESLFKDILPKLNIEAAALPIESTDLIASDWLNGRRTPFADQTLKGGVSGITLATTPAQMFKSLVEATAFGSKAIMKHLENEGVKVTEVIGVGGISLKSPYVMQTLSNIMGVPIKVAAAQQAGALGVAMCASVAAGIYAALEHAQDAMGQGVLAEYKPNDSNKSKYKELYIRYKKFGEFLESK
jgi:L-ribulokinase